MSVVIKTINYAMLTSKASEEADGEVSCLIEEGYSIGCLGAGIIQLRKDVDVGSNEDPTSITDKQKGYLCWALGCSDEDLASVEVTKQEATRLISSHKDGGTLAGGLGAVLGRLRRGEALDDEDIPF